MIAMRTSRVKLSGTLGIITNKILLFQQFRSRWMVGIEERIGAKHEEEVGMTSKAGNRRGGNQMGTFLRDHLAARHFLPNLRMAYRERSRLREFRNARPMTQHRPIGGGGPDWSLEGRTIVCNFPATAFWRIVRPLREYRRLASFPRRDCGRLRPVTAMADPGGWAPAQENDFSNFQSNDSFNLNEVTGIDGRSCAPVFFTDVVLFSPSPSPCLSLSVSLSLTLECGIRAYFEKITWRFIVRYYPAPFVDRRLLFVYLSLMHLYGSSVKIAWYYWLHRLIISHFSTKLCHST